MTAPNVAPDSLETRCSTRIAAKYLGVTRRHVEKLISVGALLAWDVRLPGAKRARWSVTVSSVRLLLLERMKNTRTEDRPKY
jgi:excisionase family DNA binding protein